MLTCYDVMILSIVCLTSALPHLCIPLTSSPPPPLPPHLFYQVVASSTTLDSVLNDVALLSFLGVKVGGGGRGGELTLFL